ncbi:MAG: bifunctional 3-(3-hydroxy-phenyl)propionate/3-hydroxycinnamic acid hydroxylase [Pseudomonas sp.]
MTRTTDVVVVGAGPTGMVLSLLLARQGHRVTLLERWHKPYPLPRAIGLSHESLRILHLAGLVGELQAAIDWNEADYTKAYFLGEDREILLTMPMLARAESGWPEMQSFNQPDAEALMERAILANPAIEFRRGQVVTALTQDCDGATVSFTQAGADGSAQAGASVEQLTAQIVVGCDGANSTVANLCGITYHDLGFAYDWLVVDFKPTVSRTWDPFLAQTLYGRPTTIAPAGPGRRRFEFMLMPGEAKADMNSADVAWMLMRDWGVTPDNAELVRHAVYTFGARWAEQWNQGRVLLAGDAAHLMPPFLGQGMNSGMRDAANLAWRLDLFLRQRIPLAALAPYSEERAQNVQALTEHAVMLGGLICITDPQAAAERDANLRELRDSGGSPPPLISFIESGTLAERFPLAGAFCRQGRVRVGERLANFDELCGAGTFMLLGLHQDPFEMLSPQAATAWKKLGGKSVRLDAELDVEGTYAQWFAEEEVSVVLVRPDFYVFGAATKATDTDALVIELCQQLSLR